MYRSKYLFWKPRRHWQDLGYLIIYVTGRPCMQLRKVRPDKSICYSNKQYHYLKVVSWLSMHNFPEGLVSFADGFSTDPLGHKTEFLKNLQDDHSIGRRSR